jgi:hypothetical protein
VFSSSIDDPGAFVCCNNDDVSSNPIICRSPVSIIYCDAFIISCFAVSLKNHNYFAHLLLYILPPLFLSLARAHYIIIQYYFTQQPAFLLFAGRLSRFPDAWLLPLFPLFFRGIVHILRRLQGSRGSTKSDSMYAKRRLLLYIALIQIRGWVLYLLFDNIEAMFVSAAAADHEECWYEDLLLYRKNYETCQGRVTDFSDHVVLFYAQILPIALTEVLHSYVLPYWETRDAYSGKKKYFNGIPLVLLLWLGNLYVITFLGAYKTSVYFHTAQEVFAGYLVSLCIQVPLCLLQCTVKFPRLRDWLYGHAIS